MATVTAFIKHSNIGKAKQAEPYTAAAHVRYITRKNAASLIYSERMPRQYHAVQRFLNHHEDTVRKNGRVIEKFIISVPHDISEADAVNVLRRFGNRIGKGEAPFLFALHGFDGRNHHAHFIFIDKGEDGRRVFGMSERGSTAKLKLAWEEVANGAFQDLGYDVRVKVHEGYEERQDVAEAVAANDNEVAPLRPDNELEPQADSDDSPAEIEQPEDVALDDEEDGKVDLANIGGDPVANIRFMHEQVGEREALQAARARIEQARVRYQALVAERTRVAVDAGDFYQDSLPTLMAADKAEERLMAHQTHDGKLRGFSLNVFGVSLFKTRARKEAEQVSAVAHDLKLAANQVEYTRKAYDQRLYVLDHQASQAEQAAFEHQAALTRVYGTDEEINHAERFMENSIDDVAFVVSLEDAMSAYLEGAITPDEYRTFLREAGYTAELQLLEEQLAEGEGQSL
ncbi:MobA/MobL family protein [Mesorhizobium sp. BR-1-1-10]|uniref:MobA/MobL family protein n=1 Tax=Mesorhizobium sp. BR-1-1-10 TaxID=2876660 RepID=UPI001CD1911E|nr:MobA/MobL family protein [Mesorhizobium sp. BR-1-1-10]MBZ9975462.1 MobA/MobL family protein [Mesorhizobium sp. BR-1-1-10]